MHTTNVATILADSNGLVTGWNPAAADLVGYRAEEIIGHDVAMLVPEEQRDAHRHGFRRAMDGAPRDGDAPPFHLPVVRADQSVEVFAARLSVLDGPYGRPVGALVMLERTVDAADPFTPVDVTGVIARLASEGV